MEQNNGNLQENQDKQAEAVRPEAEAKDKPLTGKAKVKKEIREWIVALVVALLVVAVLQGFLFRVIHVAGHSMDTTLADGEGLFVTVADVRFGDLQRDSVVICHYPNRYNAILGLIKVPTYFVKRCVGLPGDTVYCENGVTHIVYEQDGETVDEALDERYALYYLYGSPYDYDAYVLGEDEYFVVGDNRYNSHDSRDWDGDGQGNAGGNDGSETNNVGPLSKSMIVGRVREVIWPLNAIRPVA